MRHKNDCCSSNSNPTHMTYVLANRFDWHFFSAEKNFSNLQCVMTQCVRPLCTKCNKNPNNRNNVLLICWRRHSTKRNDFGLTLMRRVTYFVPLNAAFHCLHCLYFIQNDSFSFRINATETIYNAIYERMYRSTEKTVCNFFVFLSPFCWMSLYH